MTREDQNTTLPRVPDLLQLLLRRLRAIPFLFIGFWRLSIPSLPLVAGGGGRGRRFLVPGSTAHPGLRLLIHILVLIGGIGDPGLIASSFLPGRLGGGRVGAGGGCAGSSLLLFLACGSVTRGCSGAAFFSTGTAFGGCPSFLSFSGGLSTWGG